MRPAPRWADGHYEQLPKLAAELVGNRVAVILAGGPAKRAAKAATTMIPIVFVTGEDPYLALLAASTDRTVTSGV